MIQHRLDNGLTLVVAPEDSLPLAATALYYDVGARNEEAGKTGFAHLFEHLMFEGSANVQKGTHFSLISGLGGQINANTTHERTLYYASLPANQLDVVLWMEADRMRSLRVDEESFEHQRKTVLEERKQRVEPRLHQSSCVVVVRRPQAIATLRHKLSVQRGTGIRCERA